MLKLGSGDGQRAGSRLIESPPQSRPDGRDSFVGPTQPGGDVAVQAVDPQQQVGPPG